MNWMLALLVVLGGPLPVHAEQVRLPEWLYGLWESDPANCTKQQPVAGKMASFRAGANGSPDLVNFVEWSGDGLACKVVKVDETDGVLIGLSCVSDYQQEATRPTVKVELGRSAKTLLYWLVEGDRPVLVNRCTRLP